MKRIFSLLLSLIVIFSVFTITAYADDSVENSRVISEEIEYYEDGSYAVITLVEEDCNTLARAASTKTTYKSYTYRNNDGDVLWAAKLTATFSYTGSSATCTSAKTSYSISKSSWKCSKNTASKSGRTAKGDFTFKKLLLISKSVTISISCSNSGVIS